MEIQQNLQSNKPKLNIGFFFLCLGVLISLTTSVVSFLNLIFSTLDKQFPDVLNSTYQYGYNTNDFQTIRISIATLIIFFPIFIVVSYFWRKFTKFEMGLIDEILKKWVIYIILFLSSIVIAIDLVTLINYFVSGEITNRFVYKVLATFVVVLIIGLYYILLLKFKKEVIGKLGIIIGIIGVCIVTSSIIYSFSIIGSPSKQRNLRLDEKRINDLQNIQSQIINYWQQKEKLPNNLKELSNPISGYSLPVPPLFDQGEVYGYNLKDENKLIFQICTNFALPIQKGWSENRGYYGGGVIPMYDKVNDVSVSSYPYSGGGINESWEHESGYTCFERTIDKDIYKPFSKQ